MTIDHKQPKAGSGDKAAPNDKRGGTELRNEGEGSRSGARHYDKGATEAASHPEHVKEAARKAADALKGAEGEELRKAEERGKRGEHR